MKKYLGIIALFALAACSPTKPAENKQQTETEDVTTPTTTPQAETSSQENHSSDHAEATPSQTTEQSGEKNYDQLGEELFASEAIGPLELEMKLADVTPILGEPTSKGKNEMWDADGMYHQDFVYKDKGITLDMEGKTDADKTVRSIYTVSPSTYKTSKGIKVGSTTDELKEAYKKYINPELEEPSSIRAVSIYSGVLFKIKDGKVEAIYLGPGAE